MTTVRLAVDDETIEYHVDGATAYGADEVLLDGDDDLLAGTAFADAGFTVAPFLAPALYATLVDGVGRLLCAAAQAEFGLEH